MGLPININELLTGETVEWERIELKKGWNPLEILHTICAYANDINNWGGGYIIIGIEQKEGVPIFPPAGLSIAQIEHIQNELTNLCYRLRPQYFPIVEPVKFQDKMILVIWVYGGQVRPYKAPDAYSSSGGGASYYIRRFTSTTKASVQEERDLILLSANTPYDDRINPHAEISDLKLGIVKSFLQKVGSSLFAEVDDMPFVDLCRRMNIVEGPDEYIKPKNIGLLLFNDNPSRFFPCAQIDIVEFRDDAGKVFTEKTFKGPIHTQLEEALGYLKNHLIIEKIVKEPGEAKSLRFYNYPFEAIEESLVNTVYHRSYQDDSPIEVRIYPSKIEMLSYPGPLPPLNKERLESGDLIPRKYRNRRIGDFLKELHLTEGRGTGIPTIRQSLAKNGSSPATFETDDDLTYFRVVIPIHPSVQPNVLPNVLPSVQPDFISDGVVARESAKRSQNPEIVGVFILEYCKRPKKRREILGELGLKNRHENYRRYIQPLLMKGWIAFTIPENKNHESQQYRTTPDGERAMRIINNSDTPTLFDDI